jgi:hypothetical protein
MTLTCITTCYDGKQQYHQGYSYTLNDEQVNKLAEQDQLRRFVCESDEQESKRIAMDKAARQWRADNGMQTRADKERGNPENPEAPEQRRRGRPAKSADAE